MTDAREYHHGYEPPTIEARAEIGPTLIGALSSNTDVFNSAAFTHI